MTTQPTTAQQDDNKISCISTFVGNIFGYQTHTQWVFNTMDWLDDAIKSNKDNLLNDPTKMDYRALMRDIAETLDEISSWGAMTDLDDVESGLRDSLESFNLDDAESLSLRIYVFGYQSAFANINQKLADGVYLTKQQKSMLNIDLLSPLAAHTLYIIIKQWQDTEQNNEDELLQLLNHAGNNLSYLCAEHRPNLAKIMRADSYQKLLDSQDNDLFTDILDGFDMLFLDEYKTMQNRLLDLFGNGYTLNAFNDDINTLLSEHKHKLTCLECTP